MYSEMENGVTSWLSFFIMSDIELKLLNAIGTQPLDIASVNTIPNPSKLLVMHSKDALL